MRRLLASTSLGAMLVASTAVAQTTIDTRQAAPVRTSTIKAGARDSIRIGASGSVVPTGGVAVTIDSDNTVANAGTLQVTGANDATAILAQDNVRSDIANSGKLIVDETYVPADTDKDGDLDGPFAQGARRFGIRTAGRFNGNIANSGEITVKGNDSAGIFLGGATSGNVTHDGKTTVTGDRATGIRLDAVTGNVTLGGTIAAIGKDAVGARLDGDVGGALTVQGAIGASGYRYTTPPPNTARLDADDLLQGGSALMVAGNVGGGIVLGNATGKVADVVSLGAAPAFQIGAVDRAVTIGAVAGRTPAAGLAIDGKVTGNGLYGGVAGNALAIGGRGGTVTIQGGIAVGGTVQAAAGGAGATAIRLGSGVSTPELRNTGTISAVATGAGTPANAILVDRGATLPAIRNSGTIRAGAGDTALAILDRSGTLALVENSGAILASGGTSNVAIDLSANTGGAIVRQVAGASGAAAPTMTGAIRFGAGNDVLEVAAGTIAGDIAFGVGSNRMTMTGTSAYNGTLTAGNGADTLAIGDTARFVGTADLGGGADRLAITGKGVFAGRLLGATNAAVTVAAGGGTFAPAGATTIASLDLGAQSTLSVGLDRANPAANLIQVTGSTAIGADSKLALRVTGGADVVGRYVVLQSGSLSGIGNLSLTTENVPFLYKGTLLTTLPNQIAVDVARKATGELGFNRAQARAFDAIDVALGSDVKVAAAIRGIYDGNAFRGAVDQMLPNYAGGVFEGVTLGSRVAARQLAEPAGAFTEEGRWGFWLTPLGWDSSKATRSTLAYDVNGWGVSSGLERKTDIGNIGVSLAYLSGRNSEGVALNRIDHRQYEMAGHWRGHWGGVAASARASAAWISFDGVRRFDGKVGNEAISRSATADWNGQLYSGAATLSYERMIARLSLRPTLALDYYRLNEDAYREQGGGRAMDLTVRERTSDELALTASLAAGLNIGGSNRYDQWTRLEVESGWRERVAGAVGATTASFAGGTPFTLDPEARDGGWVAKARAITGTTEVRLSGEVAAERRFSDVALSARAALQFAF
ncbi:MAG: autotransporter domain-containing protein [Sphingomonas phyllosphaerae]|uniref:autotransporter outer membrane beta-barrel domain-containing protein n=1 Tax=Sphingomonas phyllosphaerae TaxID=257003 RepID=UPI002FF8C84F